MKFTTKLPPGLINLPRRCLCFPSAAFPTLPPFGPERLPEMALRGTGWLGVPEAGDPVQVGPGEPAFQGNDTVSSKNTSTEVTCCCCLSVCPSVFLKQPLFINQLTMLRNLALLLPRLFICHVHKKTDFVIL